MVKQRKKNNRKKRSSKGFTANSAKVKKMIIKSTFDP